VGVIFFGYGTGRGFFDLCGDDDGGPVVVGSADEDDVFAETPEIAYVEIAGDVRPEVPKMAKTVCIGQTARNDSGLISHVVLFGVDEY
jgi:hypothetical protein